MNVEHERYIMQYQYSSIILFEVPSVSNMVVCHLACRLENRNLLKWHACKSLGQEICEAIKIPHNLQFTRLVAAEIVLLQQLAVSSACSNTDTLQPFQKVSAVPCYILLQLKRVVIHYSSKPLTLSGFIS